MLKLLITGGAGFIGSNFVRFMLKQHPEYRILNLDKLTYAGNLENLAGLEHDSRHEFIQGDICDDGLVAEILKKGVWPFRTLDLGSMADRLVEANPNLLRVDALKSLEWAHKNQSKAFKNKSVSLTLLENWVDDRFWEEPEAIK